MGSLQYSIDIKAPKQKVWETMLDEKTYKQWTAPFSFDGSGAPSFEGSWEEDAKIRFVAKDKNGKLQGLSSRIAVNKPGEFLSIEHLREIVDGQERPSPEWAGAHESYTFTEDNGVTTVDVEIEDKGMAEGMRQLFDDVWPKSLDKLKEICEK